MKKNNDQAIDLVRTLLNSVGGKTPITQGGAVLSQNLHCYMDGKLLSKHRNAWYQWVAYLHHYASSRIRDLSLEIQSISQQNNIVKVDACWHGTIKGNSATSDIGSISYKIKHNQVTAIYTHKRNYAFIYGKSINNPLVFYYWILRVVFSKRRY